MIRKRYYVHFLPEFPIRYYLDGNQCWHAEITYTLISDEEMRTYKRPKTPMLKKLDVPLNVMDPTKPGGGQSKAMKKIELYKRQLADSYEKMWLF